jgi:DNA-binding MarR family transcriptional regulator
MQTTSDHAPGSLLSSLLIALHWIDDSLQARLEAAGWPRVNFSKSMVMANLLNGVSRPADLARNLGVSRQAIFRTLAEMTQDGLVVVQDDPHDRRAKIVSFNSGASELMRDALRALAAIQDDLALRLGRAELDHLIATLARDWGPLSTGAE